MRRLLASSALLLAPYSVTAQTPCDAAETPCGLPGVTVVVSPSCAQPGEVVQVTLRNDSSQTIALPSGCVYVGVYPGTTCGGLPAFSPACTFALVPIPPGGSYTFPWFQNDDLGAAVPGGRYSFQVWYWDAGFTSLIECCAQVTLASSCPGPSAVPRNGSGSNPATLASVQAPQLGSTWSASLDCTAHAPGQAYLVVFDSPASGTFNRYGEILVSGMQVLGLSQPHTRSNVTFSAPVPPLLTLCGRRAYAQGLCSGAPRPRLSNALDLVLWD